jgi:hypothetical protein
MARDWKARPAPAKTSLTEIARRYHAAAVALAQTLGLPLEAVLSQHRESVTAIFIEASRCELRLPAGVHLPPLVVAAPVATTNGQAVTVVTADGSTVEAVTPETFTHVKVAPEGRISRDQARELKRLAQTAFGYAAGERQLRQDLGLADDARLTLMRLSAHTTAVRYAALCEAYAAHRGQAVEVDVP